MRLLLHLLNYLEGFLTGENRMRRAMLGGGRHLRALTRDWGRGK